MRTELLREVLAHRLPRLIARRIDGLIGGLIEERRHRVIVKALVDERIRCRMAVLLGNGMELFDA